MWICGLVLIFFGSQPALIYCGSNNCSFGGPGELEMRLRRLEKIEGVEGVVDFGEEEQTKVSNENTMKGNWEKIGVNGAGEEGGVPVERQKRGIFFRDNVALARFFTIQILTSKLVGIFI